MSRYLEIFDALLRAVADGDPAVGAPLPSVREMARREGTTPATVGHAYRELAEAGVIVTAPRRSARVAADGAMAARRRLRGGRPLRVAGSDDPALDLLLARVGSAVDRVASNGSFEGLTALWQGRADAATLHLWHAGGAYNAPYAQAMLAGRTPTLVHLWRREQGILVPPGNPEGIGAVTDLTAGVVALRGIGTGTRVLIERLLREAGGDPATLHGPVLANHLEVGLAVAAGLAPAGVAVRGVARALGLGFVTLAWEPFDLALPGDAVADAQPLVEALADAALLGRISALTGYDVSSAGGVVQLGP